MNTLTALLPTIEAWVCGGVVGVLLAVTLPTPARRKLDAEAAGRAAAERVIAEMPAALTRR